MQSVCESVDSRENSWSDWLFLAVRFMGGILFRQNSLAITVCALAVCGSTRWLRPRIHRWHSCVDFEFEEMAMVVLSLYCSIYEFRLHRLITSDI